MVAETTEEIPEIHPHRGRKALVQAAGVGMALMGSSMPGSKTAGASHVDHGYAPARWAAVTISGIGWLIGGVAFPFGIIWLVVLGGLLQLVAIAVNLTMNAAGHGALANDQWARTKAQAKAARAEQR